MLIEYRLDGKIDKVQMAIDRLKAFEPKEGYRLGFSGGKDSVVIKRLAEMAGVKFQAVYNVSSVDMPEVVRFIKSQKDVKFERAHDAQGKPITMWSLIRERGMPPTLSVRYCCQFLKENPGKGSVMVTGVRWAESARRRKKHGAVTDITTSQVLNNDNDVSRRYVEQCYRTHKILVNPIIDWEDEDVWEFIRTEHIPYCGLYDEGIKRVGCIGCPMIEINRRKEQFARYPKFYNLYVMAFDRMIAHSKELGRDKGNWKTGQDVMNWWLREKKKHENVDQLKLWDDENEI